MPKYETRGGRASICHWDLTFQFLLKEQAIEAMNKIFTLEYDLNVSYIVNCGVQPQTYTVTISDMCWAVTLTEVAKILESVDWSDSDKTGDQENPD